MIRALTILCVILIHAEVRAQKDFREGYIVIGKDTARGLVEYRVTKGSQKSILFKQDGKSEAKEYSITEVKGFGFPNRQFERIEVNEEQAFGRLFSKGLLSLYRIDTMFYVTSRKVDSLVVLRPPFDRIVEIGNSTVGKTKMAKTERPYVGTLNYMVVDCGLKADKAGYSPKDLTNVVDAYNKCHSDVVKLMEGPWVTIRPYLLAGYVQSRFAIDSLPASIFGRRSSVTGGFGLEISTPRKFDRLTFSFEALYASVSFSGVYFKSNPNVFHETTDEMYYDASYLKFPMGVKYSIRGAGSTLYFRGGGYVSVLTKHVESRSEREINSVYFGHVEQTLTNLNRFRTPRGLYLAIGYEQGITRKLKFFAEARGERGAGFVGGRIRPESRLNSVAVMAGVRF